MRPPSWKRLVHRRLVAIALSLLVLGGLGWAALAPIEAVSHDELFEIPRGTSARRMAGEAAEILPQTIRLTLGLNDVLVLRNADNVPHIFGPTLIMPGQSFSLPFTTASTYIFPVHRACRRAAQRDRGPGARPGVGQAPLALAQADSGRRTH